MAPPGLAIIRIYNSAGTLVKTYAGAAAIQFRNNLATTLSGNQVIVDATAGGGGLGDPGINGIVVRTALNTTTARSLAATVPVTVSNADGTAGNPTVALSIGDNLITDGSSKLSYTCADRTAVQYHDDFFNMAGNIGDFGAWSAVTIGAAPTLGSVSPGVWPHVGISSITTTAVSGQGGAMIAGRSTLPLGLLGANGNWDFVWIFQIPTTTTVSVYVGVSRNAGNNPPADFIGLRYDTALGDTNFLAAVANGTVYTTAQFGGGIAVDGNWHRLVVTCTTAGTVTISLDGTAAAALTQFSNAVNFQPSLTIITNTTATRTANVDFFAFHARGLSR